jgi:hypothetical protein
MGRPRPSVEDINRQDERRREDRRRQRQRERQRRSQEEVDGLRLL